MATVALGSLVVAASFLLLGTLKLANLIRFVPYPLIVGFIGGMGWLLIGGAVRVVTGLPLDAREPGPSGRAGDAAPVAAGPGGGIGAVASAVAPAPCA